MAESCGAGDLANQLLPSLLEGKDFTIPDIDWDDPSLVIPPDDPNDPVNNPVRPITLEELTTGEVGGSGAFDRIAKSFHAHLKVEFDKGRITGNDYTTAYVELFQTAIATGTQFLLGKDQAYWQAVMAQAQAKAAQVALIISRVQLVTAKAQAMTAQIQAMTAEAEYGLTKMKIATEDATYCNLLAQKEQTTYQTVNLLPAQKTMIDEQAESARAQTLDVRKDGAVVKGAIGKQKDLHAQQITSFQRDSEVKAAKLFTDAWITQKTIDEGLTAPNGFTNASVDTILTVLKSNNGFV